MSFGPMDKWIIRQAIKDARRATMQTGDKYTDQGGATRIVTDVTSDGEVGYVIEGVIPQGGTTGKHFQSQKAFEAECAAVIEVTAGETVTLPAANPGPAVEVVGLGVGEPAPVVIPAPEVPPAFSAAKRIKIQRGK